MLLFWYKSCASDLTYIFTKHWGLTSSHLLTYHAIKYDALPQLKPITTTPPPHLKHLGLQIINVKFLKEDPLPPTKKPFSLPTLYWYYIVHTSPCVNIEILIIRDQKVASEFLFSQNHQFIKDKIENKRFRLFLNILKQTRLTLKAPLGSLRS